MSGSGGHQGGYTGSGYQGSGGAGGPRRTFEERAAAKDAMMQSLRDSSQQDRRVYVGNLSYDVKWHHLKDFMRQGEFLPADFYRHRDPSIFLVTTPCPIVVVSLRMWPLFLHTLNIGDYIDANSHLN